MRKKYLSQLENAIKLRRENSDVKIQFELSIESIKNIGLSLTADHIVHNNFSGIAEARLAKLKSIENYEHSSLDKANCDFSGQSKKLKSIWEQYLKIKDYLANLEIFNGLKEKVKENEQKYHAAKNIEEVKKCHEIITELLNEGTNLDRIINDLKYINREINKCREFFKNSSFFKEYKWLTSLKKDCANVKDSMQIEKLATKIKARKKILDTISKISSDWLKMHENLSQIYTDPSAIEHELFDKDRINIINKLSSLEKQSKLDYESAIEIHLQLEKKINSWMKIKEEPYPSADFVAVNEIGDAIVNILVFFINIFLIFCIWPFTYVIRGVAKDEIMKKPVLDW